MIQNLACNLQFLLSYNIQFIRSSQLMDNPQNQDLAHKVNNNHSFRNHMEKVQSKFRQFEQQALYSDLQASSKSMVISIPVKSQLSVRLRNNRDISFYVVLGMAQGQQNLQKTILNIIHAIPFPKKTYSLVYINTLASKHAFNDFMKIVQLFPIQYLLHLDTFYVLHASFISRAFSWVSFNHLTNYVKGKTVYFHSFCQMAQKMGVDQKEFLRILPVDIREELAHKDEQVQRLLMERISRTINFEGWVHGDHKSQQQHVELQEMDPKKRQQPNNSVSKSSILFVSNKKPQQHEIQYYQIGPSGTPLAFQLLIYFFNQREDLLNIQGIFRKNVSIDDENQILTQIENENYDYIETITDPHVIAIAIKRFLANLITPVVPYPLFQNLMTANESNITKRTIQGIKSLSDVRRKTILILLEFFLEKVIPKENNNKMGLKNVCIVIGPCIMRSEVASIKDLLYSQKIIAVTSIIFKEFDAIFGSKRQRRLSLRKSAQEFKKAQMEDRLGRYESTIKLNEMQPCELTNSQMEVVRQSNKREERSRIESIRERPKQEDDGQKEVEKEVMMTKIWQSVSQKLKEGLQSSPNTKMQLQQEQFYDIDSQNQGIPLQPSITEELKIFAKKYILEEKPQKAAQSTQNSQNISKVQPKK